MTPSFEVKLVGFDKKFLNLSWDWLNDQEIKGLTNTPDFTKKDQVLWYNSLNLKAGYLIWGITANNIPIGVCGLKKITTEDCEYWGYIGAKEYWGKGIGGKSMSLILMEAKKIDLKSIWLQVIQHNLRAVNLYKGFGFCIEKMEGDLLFMRKQL